ncbi:MAG TPA: NYN domain-containing protein [Acidisoma sp.]|jgi:uncharacterized LabA/DUF88 family protein|uniref:NYN domain-containing protein n=1 Tax=Acidisoma sp. TaxID=1872115 RepID=UPI002C17FA1A|nr:NYN domain-containing protein [Acidisoma sp.]HTI01221.1 NYN domain-containing protein [Acidisoma sp.]
MKKVVVLIDGGHARVLVRQHNVAYNPDYIEKLAHACVIADEDLIRVLYYDCALFEGDVPLPVSGQTKSYTANNNWLRELGKKDFFAIRLGILKFRGFKPKRTPITPATLSDSDFQPVFEQKGVDMRIGLDIASYSDSRSVDRFIIVTADTDCVPAFKHARKAGIQVVLVQFPNSRQVGELMEHADICRQVAFPPA